MMRYITLVLLWISCIKKGYCYMPDICSGGDISREIDFDFKDLLNKLWYVHLIIDDTNSFTRDSNLIYQYDIGGTDVIGYFPGRSPKTGRCDIILFQDTQLGRKRSCISAKTIVPATNSPSKEYISTFLDHDKSQLLFYYCMEIDVKQNRCNKVFVIAATSRKELLPGEKEKFENKIREFGAFVPVEGIPTERPTSNNCQESIVRGLEIPVKGSNRRNRPRKHYRY